MARLTFSTTPPRIKVSVLGFMTCLVLLSTLSTPLSTSSVDARNHAESILPRPKRLSVLNIIYRKGNTSEFGGTQVFGRPHYNFGGMTRTAQPTSTPDVLKFTVAPTEIAATIARLRTTRQKFALSTGRSFVPHFVPEDDTPSSSSTTPTPPPLDIPRRFPLDHPMNYPVGDFTPFHPSLNSRNSNAEKVREPLFFPVTRTPSVPAVTTVPEVVRSTFRTTTTTTTTTTPTTTTTMTTERPSKPEAFNPFFHERMPVAPPATGRTPSSTVHHPVTVGPPPFQRSATPSPTFQARLNINPERKGPRKETTTTTARTTAAPTTTGLPAVTGSPAHISCRGKIGYFSDSGPDCDSFLYCDQFGRSYKFMCPIGSQFNPRMCLCDLHSQCLTGGLAVSPDDPCPPLM
ncbi:hypothetical protein BV898_11603 [Hypsibius exemplaris]|uniref:Chitin-binding type-2 domain-containing protein n=1 Tax=Hypsibius exemplaris TaxID=2072580 RepID=A0A1W0WGC5_HYPEX|nr:hypothetical protein BV898_11603 [Hypsibius exemplaris]